LIISHPVVSDPTDYKGLPFVVEGKAEFLPFGDLREIVETRKPTVFFLDDLGQAPASVQAAAMQLLLARRINGHKVSYKVTFIAATNRRQDKAGVQGILEPVKSRFVSILNLDVDTNDWCKWAIKNNMPAELVAFIRFRPELLDDFKPTRDMVNSPCPRTVAHIGKLLNTGLAKELEYETFAGAAGEGFAAEFIAFLKAYRNLPNPDLVIMNPEKSEVPAEPSILYAVCGALASKAGENNFTNIIKYANRMPQEFAVALVKDAVNRKSDLVNTKAFIEWASDHSDVLI